MAQRVYLIPVRAELVRLFEDLVLSTPATEPACFKALLTFARPHRVAAQLSRNLAAGLSEQAMADAGRVLEYHRAECMRPYAITEATGLGAVQAVEAILADGGSQAEVLLRRQVSRLREFWSKPEQPAADDREDWESVRRKLHDLKELRLAALNGEAVIDTRRAAQTIDRGGGQTTFVMDLLHPPGLVDEEVPAEDVPEFYGVRLGQLFGRVAGLCEPTWWLSRDYWFGRLLFEDLPPGQPEWFLEFREQLSAVTSLPTDFLRRTAAPGYEAGFTRYCPGYCTGLYLPPANVAVFHRLLRAHQDAWSAAGEGLTPHQGDGREMVEQLVAEALLWADRQGVGLMEGDELVGAFGYR